ncbi:MAG: hypothetical protein ACW97W_13340 [Candidatus Hodarchaeales archaeon]|jgi:hypothetical protein
MITIHESISDEIKIVKKGSKERGLFFGILGSLFQIIFLWGYWSFLDETGPFAIFWLSIVNSEFFPFTFILFVFGAGCILVAIREFGWEESLVIKTKLTREIPGVQKELRLFRWSRTITILNNQIVTLRLHSLQLDQFNINKYYQIELDYREVPNSSVKMMLVYKDNEKIPHSPAQRLAKKIHRILSLSTEIEKTESATLPLKRKKGGEKNNSKKT